MLHLELTDDQAAKLRGLVDIAAKAGGLQVARVVVEIDDLILAADKARGLAPTSEPAAVEPAKPD